MDIASDLKDLIADQYTGFETHIRELDAVWTSNEISIRARAIYLPFSGSTAAVEALARFVYRYISWFCIPRQEVLDALEKAKGGEIHHLQNIFDRARRLFVKATLASKTQGEVGELTLFILLEKLLESPRAVCKMDLKTSTQLAYNGSDGTHLGFDSESNQLVIYWGESKMVQQISSCFDDICESLLHFITPKESGVPKQREIEILVQDLDVPPGPFKDLLLKYLDPYSDSPERHETREVFACLACFDFEEYSRLSSVPQKDLYDHFQKKLQERLESAGALFEKKVSSTNLKEFEYVLFILPFPDLQKFRNQFQLHLKSQI